MRLRDPRVWLSAVSLLAVVALFARDTGRTSPGDIGAAHAQVAELAGGESCDACHGGWLQTMTGSCNECHEAIAAQLDAGTGLHGAIEELPVEDCEACHSEHRGADFQLVSEASFSLAGFGSRAEFAHGHVAFELGGRHDELGCAECHEHADDALLAEGTARFLGVSQACASCHEDPHDGRFARSCQDCHGQEHPFEEFANFVHTEEFALVGGHDLASCAECHAEGSGYEIEALAGHEPAPPARRCEDCHADSPHRAPFLDGVAAASAVAAAASIGRADTCALCHDAEHGSFREGATVEQDLHAAAGFELDAPHADLECAACHAPDGSDFAERHPGRAYGECAACHANPHAGDLDAGPFASSNCLDCHAELRFAPPLFDLEAHAATAFALEGSHAAVACTACHAERRESGVLAFSGAPTRCDECHADAHTGSFEQAGGCSECHDSTLFSDVGWDRFEHADWTDFELDGAHASAKCEACHPRSPEPDPAGRTFGRAREVFGEPIAACATCHADPHVGQFEQGGATSCAECHSTGGFTELAAAFEHGPSTGFALEGAHARAECAGCHGTYPDPVAAGRTLGRVSEVRAGDPERCDTCHRDVHAGAFEGPERPTETALGTGCARCHDADSFDGAREGFDHGLWTGEPLEGAHARAACQDCHTPAPGRAPGPVAGTACAACHADPHVGQFAEGGPADCARCHLDAVSFAAPAFDHQRQSRFALDEAHVKLACDTCHVPWPLADGTKVVRYRPLGTRCVDCHDHGEGGR